MTTPDHPAEDAREGLSEGEVERLAEAWDEGLCAGFEIGGHAARREDVPRYDNPYRALGGTAGGRDA